MKASGEENLTRAVSSQDDQACEAVHVSLPGDPFTSAEKEAQFNDMLWQAIIENITPENFGLTDSEWEDSDYPIYETIYIHWPPCI